MVPWRLPACVATLACAPAVAATDAAARTACPVQALDQAHASIPDLKFAVFILRPANAEASPKRGPTR